MKCRTFALIAALLLPAIVEAGPPITGVEAAAAEARPFGHPGRARHDVATALKRAAENGHRAILVFGANWCHDSRALAGWFATSRFHDMLASRYEIVWVDVGKKDKNLDLARRFGLAGIAGTPTVLIVDAASKPLNLSDAPGWRNAASRSSDAIYDYFAKR